MALSLAGRPSPKTAPHPQFNRLNALVPVKSFQNRNTIKPMAFGIFAMHVLEIMFFVGMAGSVFIVAATFVRVLYFVLFKRRIEAAAAPTL
jgi:hypothetical protein